MVSRDPHLSTIKGGFAGFQGGSAKAELMALAIDDKDSILEFSCFGIKNPASLAQFTA